MNEIIRPIQNSSTLRERIFSLKEDNMGSAAVEFLFIAPIIIALFAGMSDFGLYVLDTIQLGSALEAVNNYAIASTSSVNSAAGTSTAMNIGALASSQLGPNLDSGTIVVNNGPVASISHQTIVSSGNAAGADFCYCPTVSSGVVRWGGSVTCGSGCPDGGSAGKFVAVSLTIQTPNLFGLLGQGDGSKASAFSISRVS